MEKSFIVIQWQEIKKKNNRDAVFPKRRKDDEDNWKRDVKYTLQQKPDGNTMPIWRYDQNPIIKRDAIKRSNSVFNSAVVAYENGFAGVFRCDSKSISMNIFAGFSKDGIHWEINEEPIEFHGDNEEILHKEYRYDPRVCFIEDRYYITWCNGYHGPTIGIGYTFDFKTFHQMENAFLPYNRNGVMFPRKIGGYYAC